EGGLRRRDALAGGVAARWALAGAALVLALGLFAGAVDAKKKGGASTPTVTSGDQHAILTAGAVPVQGGKGQGKLFVEAVGAHGAVGAVTDPRKSGKGGGLQLPLTDAGGKGLGCRWADQLRAYSESG